MDSGRPPLASSSPQRGDSLNASTAPHFCPHGFRPSSGAELGDGGLNCTRALTFAVATFLREPSQAIADDLHFTKSDISAENLLVLAFYTHGLGRQDLRHLTEYSLSIAARRPDASGSFAPLRAVKMRACKPGNALEHFK